MPKTVRVLHFTTHDEDCGIAKYQEQFIQGMAKAKVDVENTVFPYSPNQTKRMSPAELSKVIKQMRHMLRHNDILHIQHEVAFYEGDELAQIVNLAHRMRKKVIVTVHTAPSGAYKQPARGGLGPRSQLHYLRQVRAKRIFLQRHTFPISKADLVVAHNGATKRDLMKHGVSAERIVVIRHPVRSVDLKAATSTEISQHLSQKKGDVLFCTIGFPSATKGILDAVKSLKFLPENYKLAVIGGVHPSGQNEPFIDKICDYVAANNLQDRFYLTGYIEDDERLNALIRECDVCVYPYSKIYYAHVSSGSLNHAIGNHKPVVAYPTTSFVEMNAEMPVVQFTKAFNYYELARTIRELDVAKATKLSKEYSELFSWPQEAAKFSELYHQLAS